MSRWQRHPGTSDSPDGRPRPGVVRDLFEVRDAASDDRTASRVTPAGAAWLASACSFPQSTAALWASHPGDPVVLPCGTVFDVVNAPAVFGRRMLDHLWSEGPGSGPVALHRGRMLLFAAPGTAQRLPSLLDWRTDPPTRPGDGGRTPAVPPLLFHGSGDAVTAPSPRPFVGVAGAPAGRCECPGRSERTGRPHPRPVTAPSSRWVVAPGTRHPWLPGADALVWACTRAVRSPAATSACRPLRPARTGRLACG